MANNRMYLTCRGCGEGFFLGKIMSSGYYQHMDDFQEKLNVFFDKHHCCGDVHYENQYELRYEIVWDEESGLKEMNVRKGERQR